MTKVIEEIKKLSIAERIDLVEAIWDSIAEEEPSLTPTEKQRQFLLERSAAYDQNPESTVTWEEIKASLR